MGLSKNKWKFADLTKKKQTLIGSICLLQKLLGHHVSIQLDDHNSNHIWTKKTNNRFVEFEPKS